LTISLKIRIRLETIAVFSILQRVKEGSIQLLWSFILDYENSLNPDEDIRQEIQQLSVLAGETIHSDEAILKSAQEFEKHGIKPIDALHLSCAIKGGADYFLTCDDKIIKRVADINMKVINPLWFIEEMEV
jgi:predicted nucleic acid-binding protein